MRPACRSRVASSLPSGSSTGPGATAQTRTPGANARASERVSCASAALAAACGANSGQASSAAMSVTLTITPASPIARRAACAQKKPPVSVAPIASAKERRFGLHGIAGDESPGGGVHEHVESAERACGLPDRAPRLLAVREIGGDP